VKHLLTTTATLSLILGTAIADGQTASFDRINTSGDPSISKREWVESKWNAAIDAEEEFDARRSIVLFNLIDSDSSGRITFEEYKDSKEAEKSERPRMSFLKIDSNQNLQIEKEEWLAEERLMAIAYNESYDEAKALKRLAKRDRNGDGVVTADEFEQRQAPQSAQADSSGAPNFFFLMDSNENLQIEQQEWVTHKLSPATTPDKDFT